MSLKIRLAAVLLVIAGFAQLIYLYNSNGNASAVAEQSHRVPPANLALTLDQPVAVDLSNNSAALAGLSPREREDQQRDLLLFTAVASLGLPADRYAQIFFDLPSTRQGYMRPVASFEYGKTRSRLVQAGVVLALLPANLSAQQRREDLAYIADMQRKTQGGAFDRLMIVEYTLDTATGKASLTLRKDMPYQHVFSVEYGYIEREISDIKGLESFMTEVDDLSLMRKTGSALVLGGRKSQASAKQNIGVEEVATLWQSEQSIQHDLQRFEKYINEQEDELKAKYKTKTYHYAHEKAELDRQMRIDMDAARARIDEYKSSHKLRAASGFSLDPAADFPRMGQAFEEFATRIMPLLDEPIAPESISAAALALKKGDMGPYEKLKHHNSNPVLRFMLSELENKFAFQAARYDGNLEGTEVGMVLFYTDLLAKLWTIDFMHQSPARGLMPVFLDDPAVARNLSLVYMAEAEELSSARLWFGHTEQGYQLSSGGDAMLLASNVTRIFSAGTNPENPGKEVQTSAFLAASIDWWNDHYEEVAALEPQYQRLNQIMKWSVLIAWLNNSGEGDKLKFLEKVKVRRDFTFANWTSQRQGLRFTKWAAIGLRPPGTNGIATESMPRLSGEVTSGGVSLASKQNLKIRGLDKDVTPLLRRSTLRGEASTGGAMLKAADDTAFRFRQGEGASIVSATPKSGTKLRAQSAEFANADIEYMFKVNGGKVEAQSKIGGKPLESLHIERGSNGFSVGLHASDMAHVHRLANLAAIEASPHALLADPLVESLIQIGPNASYAAKLRDSARWVRIDPENKASVALEAGWLMRAAPPVVREGRVVRAKLMSDVELLAEIPEKSHIVVRLDQEGRTFLHALTAPPPTAPLGTVDTGSGVLKAVVDPVSKSIHLVSDAAWNESTLHLARRLGASQIDAIRNGGNVVLPPDAARTIPLIAALKNRNYRDAAASMAAAPATAKQEIAKVLAKESKHNAKLLAALGPDDALHHIDELIDIYGPQPELLVRKGLLQIERGNLEAAAQIAAHKPRRPLVDRSDLFDEINARMVSNGGVRDNLWRYAQYVDQVDASLGKKSLGFMRPTTDGNRFDFDFVFNTKPTGTLLSSAVGIPENAKVYWQANSSLNGVDWSGPLNAAIAQTIQGKLGKILHLTEDSIADYRPGAVWLPDSTGVELKFTATGVRNITGVNGRGSCNGDSTDSLCQSGRDSKAPRDVYLVMAN